MNPLCVFIVGVCVFVAAAAGQTPKKPQHLKQAVKIADKAAERCGLRYDSPVEQIEVCADTVRNAKPFEPTIEASILLKTVNNEPDGALTIIGTFEARSYDGVSFFAGHEQATVDSLNHRKYTIKEEIDHLRKLHKDSEDQRRKRDKELYVSCDFQVPLHLQHQLDDAQTAINNGTAPIFKSATERKEEAEMVTVTLIVPGGAEVDVDRTALARAKRATFHFSVDEFRIGLPFAPTLHERIPTRTVGITGTVLAVNPKKAKVADAE